MRQARAIVHFVFAPVAGVAQCGRCRVYVLPGVRAWSWLEGGEVRYGCARCCFRHATPEGRAA